jgi:chemotaxis protein CheD
MSSFTAIHADDREHQIFLEAGQVFLSSEPASVSTVLGSCVSVCLWDPTNRTGGVNHFVLPEATRGERTLRHGDAAIDRLVSGMLDLGCRRAALVAKVFGGANVLPVASNGETVGSRNIRFAFDHLRRLGIGVSAHRVGGQRGSYLRFATHTGIALVRPLQVVPDKDDLLSGAA